MGVTKGPKSMREDESMSEGLESCPWCSARVPVGVSTCPACQATINAGATAEVHLAGVTEVAPELRAYAEQVRTGKPTRGLLSTLFSSPGDPAAGAPDPGELAALQPPSAAVRAEMARIDAEIAATGVPTGTDTTTPPGPTASSSATAPESASPTSGGEPAPDAAPPPTRRRRRKPPA
jgi:hypothetical protein